MEQQKLPTVKQLQCFLAVAQTLNFRRAAQSLDMTQPPLSRQIQCLEETLGCAVLKRSTHAVELTEAGQILEQQARNILGLLSQAVNHLQQTQNPLRIGLTDMLDLRHQPDIAALFHSPATGGKTLHHAPTSLPLLQRLINNELDLAISVENALPDAALVYTPLHVEPLLLALPTSHPAAALAAVSLEDVRDLPLFWFSRSRNPALYDKYDAILKHRAPRLIEMPQDRLQLLNAISSEQGVALLPASLCHIRFAGVTFRPLITTDRTPFTVNVYLVQRREDERRQVVDLVNQLLASTSKA